MNNVGIFISNNAEKTRKLGEMLARELRGGKIICLTGELGSGKTTFAQGVLRGLGMKGPLSSPTFVIVKHYRVKISKSKFQNIYHIDCYRVKQKDILDLGWEEIVTGKNNVVIVEWAERIRKIIPKNAVWIKFEHVNKSKRKIIL